MMFQIFANTSSNIGFVTRIFQEANLANPSLVKPRVEPVTIFLRGAAGIGKTKLVYRLASLALLNSKKITPDMKPSDQKEVLTQNVYSRRIDNEFWDGYHGQEVTVVDDFGQAQDSVANPNKEYLEFIMCLINLFFFFYYLSFVDYLFFYFVFLAVS